MKKASNIWVRRGLLLHRLHGQELALALLLKQKPMSAPQIYSSLFEKEIRFDRKKIGKLLADLEWWGVVSNDSGVYSCQCAVLDLSLIHISFQTSWRWQIQGPSISGWCGG